MEVYALFANIDYESTDLLGIYTSRDAALRAAVEFLRSEDGEDYLDVAKDRFLSDRGLFINPRELDAPSPIGPWDANDRNEWLVPNFEAGVITSVTARA